MDIYKILETLKRVEETAPQLNEYLVKGGMPVKDVLALNLFQDFDPEEGCAAQFPEFANSKQWQQVVRKYSRIADELEKQILAINQPLTHSQAEEIEEVWYDGSDAYDDMEIDYLVNIYNRQIATVEAVIAGELQDDDEFNEGVAETMTMNDAVKVLRQYGADHFRTGSETLYFYKNGRPFSLDLTWTDDATRSVSLSQLNSATRKLKGQGIEEGHNPVESDYGQWEYILKKDGYRGEPSGAYALELVAGDHRGPEGYISTIRNILTYAKQNSEVLGQAVSDRKTVKDAIMDIKREYPQYYQAAQQPQGMAETSMTGAAKHSTGPKFTGYWKGTDKRTPGKHMVGAAESVEHEISEGWNNYLAEFGADNAGGTAGLGQTVADKQKVAKELSNVTGAINKAKSTGVLPQGLGTTQAAQAVMQDPKDVNSATTAQKKELGAAGDSFNDFIKAASTTPGGQSALNTVLSTMKKLKSTPGA